MEHYKQGKEFVSVVRETTHSDQAIRKRALVLALPHTPIRYSTRSFASKTSEMIIVASAATNQTP